jgi:hypothetical protein
MNINFQVVYSIKMIVELNVWNMYLKWEAVNYFFSWMNGFYNFQAKDIFFQKQGAGTMGEGLLKYKTIF